MRPFPFWSNGYRPVRGGSLRVSDVPVKSIGQGTLSVSLLDKLKGADAPKPCPSTGHGAPTPSTVIMMALTYLSNCLSPSASSIFPIWRVVPVLGSARQLIRGPTLMERRSRASKIHLKPLPPPSLIKDPFMSQSSGVLPFPTPSSIRVTLLLPVVRGVDKRKLQSGKRYASICQLRKVTERPQLYRGDDCVICESTPPDLPNDAYQSQRSTLVQLEYCRQLHAVSRSS
jgi:hypothetical protein